LKSKKTKKISKSYRTFLFKERMINIISIMQRSNPTICYFCGLPFDASDFPIDGRDKVDIHHVSYSPEYLVLAHTKCHKKFHAKQKKIRTKV